MSNWAGLGPQPTWQYQHGMQLIAYNVMGHHIGKQWTSNQQHIETMGHACSAGIHALGMNASFF
jgi:hypothetical protein